jgi:hypothetical protein
VAKRLSRAGVEALETKPESGLAPIKAEARLDGLYGSRRGLPINPVVIALDNGSIHVNKTATLAVHANWLTVQWLSK